MIDEILTLIQQYETIIIHRHVRPDPDALGSQGGLATLIKDNYPDKKVYVVGEEAESLRFLIHMDAIEDSVYNQALVIVCDAATQERISDERYMRGTHLVKIDHHPLVDSYGEPEWVNTQASSTSEMIASIYRAHPELTLSKEAARLLFAGLVGDTGRFQFSNVTSETFLAASELVKQPFDRQSFFDQLYARSLKQARLNGYVLQHFSLTEEGVGYIRLTKELVHSFGLEPSDASALVNCFANVEHLKAWVLFSEDEDQIRARIRSKAPSIHELAAKYHGGGHPMASGATVADWEEADQLVDDLRALCAD
ncbi:DHH family phosphoesterase [Sporolactobacillus terrae]|uniref:Oligoribonuclease n=1 Tax=Sporolactobacillus terrae TaxID=269673 RepID=A0A410DAB5_9BACL|nr:bifunctional oligoribonuclease/PAP phosphatase NrnA [Sporolactobacillus terrae]QAA23016.1 bifunctional oligoribonuclease/PAP phosphatase NrnA [Sporolactobacillus terrae]QAA25989.1 bifunctional oligoribonuclease/PAP phosphatase NrnA [Sporolactobacillus terrae]UAK15085.1 bifunctional oligoribonuclease/PAP phosphatase NrnA [Sporolactobacillus terrae]BBN99428.1 oligoribonuclease [Sporolactobacillus terrae]